MNHSYKAYYRVPELKDIGVGSRTYVYNLIAQGRLRAVKNGRLTLIDGASVESYMKSLPSLEIAVAG